MRFNSLLYFAFLTGVVGLLWATPQRMRRNLLLVASALFYASWHPPYLLLLFGIAAMTQLGAKWMTVAKDRKRAGAVVVTLNLLVLGVFKYLGWLETNTMWLARALGFNAEWPMPQWVLPLGLSFFIFECISYIVDLSRKRETLHPWGDFMLFVAFFPKLIAGPILRAKELLPQIKTPKPVDASAATSAISLLCTGLFLKTVVADGLAPSVDSAFAKNPHTLGTLDVWVMAVGFGLQIYFDFASYSRMAIGSARLCGIELVENFNNPYLARSPADFWNRWHMSLSRWIRDYVFFPMVGKKTTLSALMRAAIGSMVLCGIWHGAGWTFVAWGAWHGLGVASYHLLTHQKRSKPAGTTPDKPIITLIGIGATFGFVMLGWIFFRSTSVTDALTLFGRALWPVGGLHRTLSGTFYLQVAAVTACVWLFPALMAKLERSISQGPVWLKVGGRGLAWGTLACVSLLYLRGQTAFIYFQF